jgi:uncharacterized membrane protein
MNKPGWLVLIVAAVLAAFFILPYFAPVELPQLEMATLGSETVSARVTDIIEEGTIDLGDHPQLYQVVRVEPLEGPYQGIPLEVDYGKRQVRADDIRMQPGDRIMITIGRTPANEVTAYFVDFIRTGALLWITAIFAAAILFISGWKGVRSLLSMAFSLAVIIGYIIPHILVGEDPVRVSIIGSALLLGVTLYLTYGWNLKSHSAVLGMLIALVLTGLLAWAFMLLTRLSGQGDENALFLLQMLGAHISLRGLFLGGMIIGALGVLDDLVMTQASAVFELHAADPKLGFRGLYKSGMRIGQDHVAATVNTLVLAYAGGSLPMLLMFSLGRGNYLYLINVSFVSEEIVRTLVGSLGLVAAVPLTTALAIGFALYSHRLGRILPLLGPESNVGGQGHSH